MVDTIALAWTKSRNFSSLAWRSAHFQVYIAGSVHGIIRSLLIVWLLKGRKGIISKGPRAKLVRIMSTTHVEEEGRTTMHSMYMYNTGRCDMGNANYEIRKCSLCRKFNPRPLMLCVYEVLADLVQLSQRNRDINSGPWVHVNPPGSRSKSQESRGGGGWGGWPRQVSSGEHMKECRRKANHRVAL